MKTFQVYRHPTLGMQAVKVGFCWPAFFFSVIWVLVSRLWVWAMVLWILAFISFSMDDAGAIIVIIYSFISGFAGNGWRVNKLLRRGFELICTVQAATKDAAIAQGSRFISQKDIIGDD